MHKRQPELKVADISKLLGERWRNMGPSQRAKYEAKAAADKERWEKEMKAYKPSYKPYKRPPFKVGKLFGREGKVEGGAKFLSEKVQWGDVLLRLFLNPLRRAHNEKPYRHVVDVMLQDLRNFSSNFTFVQYNRIGLQDRGSEEWRYNKLGDCVSIGNGPMLGKIWAIFQTAGLFRARGFWEKELEAWVIVRLFETCPLDDAEPQHPFTKDSMLERQRPFQKVIAKVRSDIAPPMGAKGFPVGYDLVRASTLKGGIPFECTTQRNSREEGFIHPLMKPC